MAANVARRDDYDASSSVNRGTRRELERIDQQGAKQLRHIQSQRRAELERVAGSEEAALVQSRMRTRGSELLRGDAIDGIGRLYADAKAKSRGDALAERLMLGEVIGFRDDADIHAISYAGRRLS